MALLVCWSTLTAAAAWAGADDVPPKPAPISFHQPVTANLIRGYQVIISPSKGSHCPMTPHCSKFGMQAFREHNPLTAFMMVSDRLHRCGHDLQYYAIKTVDGQMRFDDPVPGTAGLTRTAAGGRAIPVSAVLGAAAEVVPAADAEAEAHRLLEFARSLEAYGDYPRAVTEYLRYLAYHPEAAETAEAFLGLIRAHYYQRAFEDVIRLGRQLPESCPPQVAAEIEYYVGLSFLSVSNDRRAIETLDGLTARRIEPFSSKAELLAARCLAHQGHWAEAQDAFAAVSTENPYHEFARRNVTICADWRQQGRKSPTIAGLMSLVPGLGYAYAGYPKTAISAFLVTSGFIWATVESYDRGNTGLGVLCSVLSFGWYTGNIYGSIGSAKRYNAWAQDRTLTSLEFGFVF